MGPIRCPETSVNNYHTTPCNYPEDHTFHQHRSGSLKSRPVRFVQGSGSTRNMYTLIITIHTSMAHSMLCINASIVVTHSLLNTCINYSHFRKPFLTFRIFRTCPNTIHTSFPYKHFFLNCKILCRHFSLKVITGV
jgi:hypothetical protein